MVIFRTGYGVGDILMASGVLRAWRRIRNGERALIVSRFPELFKHNPDVIGAVAEDRYQRFFKFFAKPFIWRVGNILDARTIKPTYPFPAPGRHLMDSMAETIGITLLPEERRPFLYLTRTEMDAQHWAKGCVAVQSSSTTYWTPNKNWVPGRMQSVVNGLNTLGCKVIQLGIVEDEALENVTDLRGKTTLREGAAILANVKLFIGLEGGLIHTARAVNCPAVVIYTGYTTPTETGYPENINIRADSAGESCWSRVPCEHCKQSADAIQVEEVINHTRLIFEYGNAARNINDIRL